MTAIKTTLLLLTFAAVQFFTGTSAAEPEVLSLSHYTDRFGPHSIPGLPVGDKVQIKRSLIPMILRAVRRSRLKLCMAAQRLRSTPLLLHCIRRLFTHTKNTSTSIRAY